MPITLHDVISNLESPLIYKQSVIYQQVPEFMQDDDFMRLLELYTDNYYGTYELAKPWADLPISTQSVPINLTNVYATNKYMLETLYKTIGFEYNPINNYDMKEVEETLNSGTDKTTDIIGARQDTRDYGNKTDTESIGEQNATLTAGQRVDNTDIGARKQTDTHNVSPMETESWSSHDQNIVNNDKATDKFTKGQEVDQTHADAYENTYTNGQHTDTVSSKSATDTSSLLHGHNINRELTRSGNIGVMSTQDLIGQERAIALFNILEKICRLIVESICIRVWTY